MADSALACYAMCAMKYDDNMSRQELALTINAMRMEAQLYFYKFYDYESACSRLAKAAQLCKRHNLYEVLPKILLAQSGVYITYANQNPSENLFAKGEEMYRQAFRTAYEQQDYNTMAVAFANLASRFQDRGRLEDLAEEFDIFGRTICANDSNKYTFARTLYKGLSREREGRHSEARRIFLSTDSAGINPRHRFKLIVSAVRSFIAENSLDSAIYLEHQLLKLCYTHGIKEGRAIVLRDLSTLYDASGDSARAAAFQVQALRAKDSLINIHHMDKVNSMAFLEEMHRLQDDIKGEKKSTRIMYLIVAALSLMLAGALYAWNIVFRRNRRALANVVSALESMPAPSEQPELSHDINIPKYVSSSLDENTQVLLVTRLQKILSTENTDIFSPKYSIDDVAKAAKSNTKYVSQAINVHYGCNFPMLLSALRVKEAERRLRDEAFRNYTVEAVGSSVGFGSRASFNNSFKRLVGMSPGEFRKSSNN